MKLLVENVLDLERASVALLDKLIEEYLFICNSGQTIGRRIGVYAKIREALEEVAKVTEQEARKAGTP